VKDLNVLLDKYIQSKSRSRFRYGKSDCCTFVLTWIKKVTKKDLGKEFLDQYTDEESANNLLKANVNLEKIAHKVLGASKPLLLTMPGDVVCMKIANEWTMGISIGTRAVFHSNKGLLVLKLRPETKSWSVEGLK